MNTFAFRRRRTGAEVRDLNSQLQLRKSPHACFMALDYLLPNHLNLVYCRVCIWLFWLFVIFTLDFSRPKKKSRGRERQGRTPRHNTAANISSFLSVFCVQPGCYVPKTYAFTVLPLSIYLSFSPTKLIFGSVLLVCSVTQTTTYYNCVDMSNRYVNIFRNSAKR